MRLVMRHAWIATAAAVGLMAAGCGEDTDRITPNQPYLWAAHPLSQLPSNSGVLLAFTDKMNIHTFTGELRPACCAADSENHSINGVQGTFEEIAYSGGRWTIYWRPAELLPLGSVCLHVLGYDFPLDDGWRAKSVSDIETVVVDPDNEPPRLLSAQYIHDYDLPSIKVVVELRFSEMVLWGRMEVLHGEEELRLRPVFGEIESGGEFMLTPMLETDSGDAVFHASLRSLDLDDSPYLLSVRDICDLAENRGKDASVLIQYEP